MNRTKRTTLVLVISIAVAAGATAFVYRAVQQMPVREVEVKSYYVAVAARQLPIGTLLKPADVKLIPWPSKSPVAGGFSVVDEIVDRGVISSVLENEPVTASKLAPREAGAGLSPTITAGMRAISVKVNDVIGVAGFVVPGARVDLVVTVSNRGESASRVVVTNVQVLTAGTKYDQEQAKDGKPVPTSVVTLLVTPEDAERIALASAQGSIMLTLRNPLDTAPTVTKGTRMASLMGAPEPSPASAAKAPAAPRRVEAPREVPTSAPSIYSVETIRAAKRAEEIVK